MGCLGWGVLAEGSAGRSGVQGPVGVLHSLSRIPANAEPGRLGAGGALAGKRARGTLTQSGARREPVTSDNPGFPGQAWGRPGSRRAWAEEGLGRGDWECAAPPDRTVGQKIWVHP